MAYSTGIVYPKSYDMLSLIRNAAISELIAINQYKMHLKYVTHDVLAHTMEHIIEEEQEHFEILMEVLQKYDADQQMMHKHILDEMANEALEQPTIYMEKLSPQDVIANIRKDIMGELEAVNLYEDSAKRIKVKYVKDIFKQIARDEKEHIEELVYILDKIENLPVPTPLPAYNNDIKKKI